MSPNPRTRDATSEKAMPEAGKQEWSVRGGPHHAHPHSDSQSLLPDSRKSGKPRQNAESWETQQGPQTIDKSGDKSVQRPRIQSHKG